MVFLVLMHTHLYLIDMDFYHNSISFLVLIWSYTNTHIHKWWPERISHWWFFCVVCVYIYLTSSGFFLVWQLITGDLATPHVDLFHPISDLSFGTVFLATCSQLAINPSRRWGYGMCLYCMWLCVQLSTCAFWLLGIKWEPIWLSCQSLKSIMWSSEGRYHIFHQTGLEKTAEGNAGLMQQVVLWLWAPFYLCSLRQAIQL